MRTSSHPIVSVLCVGTLALAATSATALVGCGSADSSASESIGHARSAVQGGKVDTSKTDTFAVGIATTAGAVCSGTLIAPNLVLTARHCVVPPTADESVTCADKFGKNVDPNTMFVTTAANMFSKQNAFYHVDHITTPKATAFCGNDIALLTLESNIPDSEAKPATPVVQFQMTDATKIGSTITAIGYGITNPSANDSGTRRIRQDIGILCVPGSETNECKGKNARYSDSDAEFVTEGWVCSGDSGSGAFDQASFEAGTPYVLGALSRGPQTADTCLAAIYSRTDAHADMIIAEGLAAAEAGGYDPPTWTQPESEAPATDTPCDAETCSDTSPTDPAPVVQAPATGSSSSSSSGCSAAQVGPGPRSRSFGATAMVGLAAVALLVARRRRQD